MSEHTQWTAEQEATWRAWVAERPPHVRVIAERLPPNRLYRLMTTGQRVVPQSFQEHEGSDRVTVTVAVLAKFNFVSHERAVFGVDPADLEECDLPEADEPTGDLGLTPDEVVTALATVDPEGHRQLMERRRKNLGG